MKSTFLTYSKNILVLATILLPYGAQGADFSTERNGTWNTFKELHIEGYKEYSTYGLVFDAASCGQQSNDACDFAVSEGAGYGLLLAAIQRDQPTFDKIFYKTMDVMWVNNQRALGWKAYTDGSVPDTHAALDGDEDMAFALLMADALQRSGKWHTNHAYKKQAKIMIDSIYETMTLDDTYLCAGNYACTTEELNFSYFSPAWYKVFDHYDHNPKHRWKKIINTQYTLLLKVANQNQGFIPDWCTKDGAVTYNGRPHNMTYDAIRVPWRIAIDSLWFKDARAKAYLNLVIPNVIATSGISDSRMYTIPNGEPIEWHNQLSVAMWAAGAWGSDIPRNQKRAFADELRSFYNPSDQAFNARWAPERWYYYNQALAMLGSATIDKSLFNPRKYIKHHKKKINKVET